ncbi:hypothetical protein EDB89DRAFT_1992789 [Lactarius sanguifluus]|nr:hypothetical protein EDB89DRAFT_1992789 [Lactarius sanguifluus]
MAIGFGCNMGGGPMDVVWPSRGADGEYNSVALLQRKALYEVMPMLDPHPPFAAKLSLTDTHVRAPLDCFRFFITFCAGHHGEPPNSVHAERKYCTYMRGFLYLTFRAGPAGRDVEQHLGIQPHTPGIGGLGCSHINTPQIGRGMLNPTPSPPSSPGIPIPKTKMIDDHDYEKAEDEGGILRVSCTVRSVSWVRFTQLRVIQPARP